MRIYALAPIGKKLARSTSNPDTDAWRVVHYLDRVTRATPDQIQANAGTEDTLGTLARLKRKGVVVELSHTEF